MIAEAAGYGSQLVLFPEVFVGGYPHGSTFGLTIGSRSAKGKEDFRKYHAAAIDVPGIPGYYQYMHTIHYFHNSHHTSCFRFMHINF